MDYAIRSCLCSPNTFSGGENNWEEETFLRRGPKAAQRRAREAQKRAREATRAAKASQNGDKSEAVAGLAKPLDMYPPPRLSVGRVRFLFWGRWVWDLGWVKRFLRGSPPL